MPVEIAAGFGLLCIFKRARSLGLAMSHTIELGLSITLAPLGLLAGRPEIHNVSHSCLDGIVVRPLRWASCHCFAAKYADTLALIRFESFGGRIRKMVLTNLGGMDA